MYVLYILTMYEVNFIVIKSNCLRCSLWVYRYAKLKKKPIKLDLPIQFHNAFVLIKVLGFNG